MIVWLCDVRRSTLITRKSIEHLTDASFHIIKHFLVYSLSYADAYVSTKTVKVHGVNDDPNEPVDCYPHGSDCLGVIVPHSTKHHTLLRSVLTKWVFWCVLLTFVLLVLLRWLITGDNLVRCILATVAQFFSQDHQTRRVRFSEYQLNVLLLVFPFFSTTFLSSMLYSNLVDLRTTEIDTIKQLAESGLPLLVPDQTDEETWNFQKFAHNICLHSQLFFLLILVFKFIRGWARRIHIDGNNL